ncbi:MAG: hypothetical protein AAF658_06485, partial [Myxococcota bacterium]
DGQALRGLQRQYPFVPRWLNEEKTAEDLTLDSVRTPKSLGNLDDAQWLRYEREVRALSALPLGEPLYERYFADRESFGDARILTTEVPDRSSFAFYRALIKHGGAKPEHLHVVVPEDRVSASLTRALERGLGIQVYRLDARQLDAELLERAQTLATKEAPLLCVLTDAVGPAVLPGLDALGAQSEESKLAVCALHSHVHRPPNARGADSMGVGGHLASIPVLTRGDLHSVAFSPHVEQRLERRASELFQELERELNRPLGPFRTFIEAQGDASPYRLDHALASAARFETRQAALVGENAAGDFRTQIPHGTPSADLAQALRDSSPILLFLTNAELPAESLAALPDTSIVVDTMGALGIRTPWGDGERVRDVQTGSGFSYRQVTTREGKRIAVLDAPFQNDRLNFRESSPRELLPDRFEVLEALSSARQALARGERGQTTLPSVSASYVPGSRQLVIELPNDMGESSLLLDESHARGETAPVVVVRA